MAHAVILVISAVPDVLAMLLLVAAPYAGAPVAVVVRRRRKTRPLPRRPAMPPAAALRVVEGHA